MIQYRPAKPARERKTTACSELPALRLAAPLPVGYGQGLAREPRTRAEAVRWLRRAEDAAPQRIRNSAAARDTVAYLLNWATATAGGRELRGMAAQMGAPV